jgi:hypothetical protein
MLDFCFKSKSNQSDIQTLLELAFSSREEDTLHTYCLKSESSVAQNFLFMYYLSRRRFREAVEIHYQISYDKKRDQIVEKLIKTVTNLKNEISSTKRNFAENIDTSRKELSSDDEQSVIMLQESEDDAADSTHKHKKVDESLLSFKIVSQTETLEHEDISETSEILSGSLENGDHEDDSSSINELQRELSVSSDDRYDLNIFTIRRITNYENSDYETRAISPIARHSISEDVNSVIMDAEFSSKQSVVNLTPLASVLKDDSIRDIAETPKAKITLNSSFKNISPFHQVQDPPKTGIKYI